MTLLALNELFGNPLRIMKTCGIGGIAWLGYPVLSAKQTRIGDGAG